MVSPGVQRSHNMVSPGVQRSHNMVSPGVQRSHNMVSPGMVLPGDNQSNKLPTILPKKNHTRKGIRVVFIMVSTIVK